MGCCMGLSFLAWKWGITLSEMCVGCQSTPSPLQPGPSPQGTSTVCKHVHTHIWVHTYAHVSQCACESMCSHVCTHACVWGPIQGSLPARGPRSLFLATRVRALPSAPGLGRAHQLCVCPCMFTCVTARALGRVGPMFLPHLPLVKRGCGEGCRWAPPHPAL